MDEVAFQMDGHIHAPMNPYAYGFQYFHGFHPAPGSCDRGHEQCEIESNETLTHICASIMRAYYA